MGAITSAPASSACRKGITAFMIAVPMVVRPMGLRLHYGHSDEEY
jgi:hypothetical protein